MSLTTALASPSRRSPAASTAAPLHGLPITIKDLYDIAGTATTCASAARFDHMATEHAFAVQRLLDAGAIILGKTNLTEFAVDLPGPRYGWARNPWDLDRIPGFSSSGSGAAIASGVGFATMGSDTGGSIRIPAAFSSCVGIKPTYGRVSRRGIFPLAWSLDHAGPLAAVGGRGRRRPQRRRRLRSPGPDLVEGRRSALHRRP